MLELSFYQNDRYRGSIKSQLSNPDTIWNGDYWRFYCASSASASPFYMKSHSRSGAFRLSDSGGTSVAFKMTAASGHIILGQTAYYVDTARFITLDGDEILLRSQSAMVLQHLVENLGGLVTRDDLISKVWPDIAVTDDSLTQCILDIRRAIGDAKRDILKTVPKRGYILRGEFTTTPINEAVHPFSPKKQPAIVARANAVVRPEHGTMADLVNPDGSRVFATASGGAHPLVVPQLDTRDILPTLAILPFKSQSGDAQDALMMFLGEEIANAISRSEDVNVISQLSTAALAGHVGNLRDIGHLLNADFILSGSMIRNDNRVVLILEFSETATQFVIWSDRMELPIDPLVRESAGVDQIITHIRRAIMLNEVRRIRSAPLQDLKLFSVLHGAIGLMHRFSLKDFKLARSYLEYVNAQAPNHPAPLAWLARWHVLRTIQGWADDPQKEAREALNFTGRALDIDPDHTLALICEGQVLTHLAYQLDDAKDRYDAALTLNPNDALGRASRGTLASFQDRAQDGTRDTERALHLTPLDPHRFYFLALAAGANISAENYPRAVTLAKESLRLNRTHASTLRVLAVAQEGAGQDVDARKTASDLLRLQPSLRVGAWLKTAPSANYDNGRRFAQMLRAVGVPE